MAKNDRYSFDVRKHIWGNIMPDIRKFFESLAYSLLINPKIDNERFEDLMDKAKRKIKVEMSVYIDEQVEMWKRLAKHRYSKQPTKQKNDPAVVRGEERR